MAQGTQNKMVKQKVEEELQILHKHFGGLVKTVLDLKSTVEKLEKKVDEKHKTEVEMIVEKQKNIEKAIAVNAAAISEIDKEILKIDKSKSNNLEKDTLADKNGEKTLKGKKCRYYNHGYCKYKTKCRYKHPKDICKQHLQNQNCNNKECCDRHPVICKWFNNKVGCRRQDSCDYLHTKIGNEYGYNFQKYECISCKGIWDDRSCVVKHVINSMETFFCLNCDDWVKYKPKVLEQGWTLFDNAGYLRTDV